MNAERRGSDPEFKSRIEYRDLDGNSVKVFGLYLRASALIRG